MKKILKWFIVFIISVIYTGIPAALTYWTGKFITDAYYKYTGGMINKVYKKILNE